MSFCVAFFLSAGESKLRNKGNLLNLLHHDWNHSLGRVMINGFSKESSLINFPFKGLRMDVLIQADYEIT